MMSEAERPAGDDNVLRPQWKQQPPDPPAGPWPLIRAAIPLLIIAGLMIWFIRGKKGTEIDSPYARIAVVAPPRVEFSDALPESAEAGMMDLARGDCQTAAAHFRTARRRNPDQPKIRMLEGASFLCARDAAEAVEVLSPMVEDSASPPQMWWYLAQACLIHGDAECAMSALEQTMERDPRHQDRARRQQRQLMVLLSAD